MDGNCDEERKEASLSGIIFHVIKKKLIITTILIKLKK